MWNERERSILNRVTRGVFNSWPESSKQLFAAGHQVVVQDSDHMIPYKNPEAILDVQESTELGPGDERRIFRGGSYGN